jgi:hypothetical protein
MKYNKRKIVGWILAGMVLLFLLFGAVLKFTPGYHEQFVKMAPGFQTTPDWIFSLILFCGIGLYLCTKTRAVGFVLLSSYLGGAVALVWNFTGPLSTILLLVSLIFFWTGTAVLHPSLLKLKVE